ncbi:MAG: DUF2783 domain-containing protein [Parvularcula sp.]|jgi:hypothetical protein|nr:DUF2783 domain-containing protein [Parvularcula sp.]
MHCIDTSPRISHPDELYQMLIDAHADLSDDASMKLNAKLILLLSNHVGDLGIIQQAVELAREVVQTCPQGRTSTGT